MKFHAKVRSTSDPSTSYLITLDASGRGLRCSCPGYVHRGRCKHVEGAPFNAFNAAFQVMKERGLPIADITALWARARHNTQNIGGACARFAYYAARIEE